MKLERPLIFIDIEATGLSPTRDRIVELALMKVMPDGSTVGLHRYFNPAMSMSAEVIAVHGITNEFLEDKMPFGKYAESIIDFITDCDFAGFNLWKFDLQILDEELRRSYQKFDFTKCHVIDAGNIFKIKEQRTLAAAVKFYTGEVHTKAHSAIGDATATCSVLNAQIDRYPDLAGLDVSQLAEASRMDKRVDLAGKIVIDEDGDYAYGFGERTKGVKVKYDVGFAHWMLGKDFSQNTKEVLQRVLNEIANQGQQELL